MTADSIPKCNFLLSYIANAIVFLISFSKSLMRHAIENNFLFYVINWKTYLLSFRKYIMFFAKK